MTHRLQRLASTLALVLAAAGTASAAESTKDIVLDRVLVPVTTQAVPTSSDALIVSVLLESPDGTLSPKGTDTLFRTQDRFRIKLLASRNAKVSIYNTTPRGETKATPIWQGEVRVGQDTISPRLALVGNSGIDQLHVVMEPTQSGGMFTWLNDWLRSSKDGAARKDVQVDVQNTETATYMLNGAGQGLVSTIQIAHTAR